MTTLPIRLFAFIGGEVSAELSSRVDLEKYPTALQKLENFFVDYKGGIKNRAGFAYNSIAFPVSKSFEFLTGVSSSNIRVWFTPGVIYFSQDGQFLLGPADTVTAVAGNVLTSAGHSFSVGDILVPEGTGIVEDTYVVTATTVNTITIKCMNGATPFAQFAASGTMKAWPLLSAANPYAADDIPNIHYDFRLDHAEVLLDNFPPYELTFDGSTFAFSEISYAENTGSPTIASVTESAGGAASAVFVVTSVDADGKESIPSYPFQKTAMVNYTTTTGYATVAWAAVAGAQYYRVYRSVILETAVVDRGRIVGLIGETYATSFTDNNIAPDFTQQPRYYSSPFAPEAVLTLAIGAVGAGYDSNATLSITSATGSGFVGYPIVVGGEIIATRIIKNGTGYKTTDTVSIVGGGGGAGATITIDSVSPASGVYPTSTAVFQQRRYYAGISRTPLTYYATGSGSERDFSISNPLVDSDSFSGTLDANEAVPISAVLPVNNSLLLFHPRGIVRLYGPEQKRVGALNNFADLQTSFGCSAIVDPIVINDNIVYISYSGSILYSVAFSLAKQGFVPVDRTILSAHLFRDYKPVRMQWMEEPHKILWVLREDGVLLSLTFLPEQEIYAWARHMTQGRVMDIVVITDLDGDKLYLTVERKINNTTVYYAEVLEPRNVARAEDFCGLDSAVKTAGTLLPVTVTIEETDTSASLLFSAAYDLTGNEGNYIRAAGGIYQINSVISTTSISATVIVPATEREHETDRIFPTDAAVLWEDVETVYGLWHLEGQTCNVLADGDVYKSITVQDGSLDVPNRGSKIVAGLSYKALAVTLPVHSSSAETLGHKVSVPRIAFSLHESRGFEYGTETGGVYEMKDGTYVDLGDVLENRSGQYVLPIGENFIEDQRVVLQTTNPLPLTVLGFAANAEVSDEL